jgi:hypothetical protein
MKLYILITALLLAIVGQCVALDLNVATLGAIGDGVTDNTAIFQKALDQVGQDGGGIVSVPTGKFRINGNLSIPEGVTLQGSYRVVPIVGEDWQSKKLGSTLLAYAGRGSNEGEPFIRIKGSSATLAGFLIAYPEWKRTDVPPVPYPPCILSDGTTNIAIIDCNILNAYEGIRLHYCARHLIRNVEGYPIWRGLYVDEIYDIGRIENVHFCPIACNYRSDDPYSKWINLNGTAFEFARTDWQYVLNTFCFGYGVGYKFSESKAGFANGNYLGIGADSCRRAVLVENGSEAGILITNAELVGRWDSTDSCAVEIGPKARAKVSLSNCSVWGQIDKCIWQRSPDAQLTVVACNFMNWDINQKEAPAIAVDAGRAIIQGNTFLQGGVDVEVGKNAISAIISGNQAPAGMIIRNLAGQKTIAYGNQQPPVVMNSSQKVNYRIAIGTANDDQFLKHWQGREVAGEWGWKGTKRWSTKDSLFILPVLPRKQYQVTLEVYVPPYALQPGAGLYCGNKQILKFAKSGATRLTGDIPISSTGQVTLEIRCKNWRPKGNMPGSNDDRVLGVAVRSITLKAVGSGKTVYQAN